MEVIPAATRQRATVRSSASPPATPTQPTVFKRSLATPPASSTQPAAPEHSAPTSSSPEDNPMKKSNPTIKAQILRSAFYVLLLLLGVYAIPFALAQWSFNGQTTSATPPKRTQRTVTFTLTFADRVAYQRVIEEV